MELITAISFETLKLTQNLQVEAETPSSAYPISPYLKENTIEKLINAKLNTKTLLSFPEELTES